MNLFNPSPVDKLNSGADGPPPVGGCGAPGGGGSAGLITGTGTVLGFVTGFRFVPLVVVELEEGCDDGDTCAAGGCCGVPLISTVVN